MIFHQQFNSESNYNFNTALYTDQIWGSHFHKGMELVYVLKGSVECTVNGADYEITEGDFCLCLPYDIHSYTPKEGALYWIIVFSEDFVSFFHREIKGKTGSSSVFRASKAVESYILEKLIYNDNPTVFTIKSCLYGICEEYLNCVELIEKDKKSMEKINLIADSIAGKYKENISLADISKEFGYDYHYMSRCFKKMFNMSFTDFVNLYRIEASIDLLNNTDEGIIHIAAECGFQSVRNFNHYFKKIMKMAPSEYRKGAGKQ